MQTQFETSKVNIYVFDTGDIITGSQDASLPNIWLSYDSIINYNKIANVQGTMELDFGAVPTDPTTFYSFYPYTGGHYRQLAWTTARAGQNELNSEEQKGLKIVSSSSDIDGYKEVYDWLFSHSDLAT